MLDVEVRGVKVGESLLLRRRETGKASTAIWLFLSIATPPGSIVDPAKRTADPGVLTDVSATTNPSGATNLRIVLEGAVDRVTLVDLRFGAWQGIEIVREGAPPAAR